MGLSSWKENQCEQEKEGHYLDNSTFCYLWAIVWARSGLAFHRNVPGELNWTGTDKAYIAVAYNLGSILVFGTVLSLLMGRIAKLMGYELS